MQPGDPLMLIALLGAHWYFDYAGQGDFMAKAKNGANPIPGVPYGTVLAAHAGIHGAAAALITGLYPVFFTEYVIHYATDDMKCRGVIGFKTDQAIHIACKFAWFIWAGWLA
jgi:hypothetical protein